MFLKSNLQGIISFLIIPNMDYNYDPTTPNQVNNELERIAEKEKMSSTMNQTLTNSESTPSSNIRHIRALFNYSPQEDLYIPCKELGLSFSKGDILHVILQDDSEWWQAYRDDDKDQTSLAGLIPSQTFQEKYDYMRHLKKYPNYSLISRLSILDDFHKCKF